MKSATAWRHPKPLKLGPPPAPKPCKRASVLDVYGNSVDYAGSAATSRAASLYDVLAACQDRANQLAAPIELVRVYVLRSAGQCSYPMPADYAACAERYMGLAPNDARIWRDPRLPIGRAVPGSVFHYVLTVYPEE